MPVDAPIFDPLEADKKLKSLKKAVAYSRENWTGEPKTTRRLKWKVYGCLMAYVDEMRGFNKWTGQLHQWCQGAMNIPLSKLWVRRLRISHKYRRKELISGNPNI